ncbi:MAG: hypothetical protein FWJ93_06970 [Micromonosporaceae bacterium]
MIAASLLLILVAVVLLGVGLARGDNASLIGSIAASLLAAIALVVGARRIAGDQLDEPLDAPEELDDGFGPEPEEPGRAGPVTRAAAPAAEIPGQASAPSQAAGAGASGGQAEMDDEEDPPDEPPPQAVSPADAARVAQLSVEVLVVDGRPRYHLTDCAHLRGRPSEPLPVSEAVELGFTPCGRCKPNDALLADIADAPQG